MKTQSLFAWAVSLAAAALLTAVPSELLAERTPVRGTPPVSISDPEVPDGRMPMRSYRGDNRGGTVGEPLRHTAAPRPLALRPETWYERILRALRALALGGPVR